METEVMHWSNNNYTQWHRRKPAISVLASRYPMMGALVPAQLHVYQRGHLHYAENHHIDE